MPLSIQYVKGLFQSRKGNIERMVEHVADSEYYSMQHFISESPWDARTGFDTVALDTNEVFKSFDQVALLIDESSDLKKGDYSVGVSRQYCGTIGKVDNCQVAVYGGLSAEHYYGLIDTALYLPESWTANRKRCKAAGVPKERYKHKTKVELAVDIVRYQLELGTHFDFPPGWEETNLPTLTFLKRNGFSFDRAFCNTCMCSPSRTTLFTGIYPAKHKVSQTLTIGGPLSPSEPTISASLPSIMNVLWNDGYDVQYRGKWHMSKGVAGNGATTNYDNLTSADISLFGAMGWIAPDAGEDVNPLNFGGGFANHDARYVAEAIKYLQEVKVKRAAGEYKPYCLIVSLVNPHDVLAYPKTAGTSGYYADAWSTREIGLPDTVNEHLLANKKPMAQEQILLGMDASLGPLATVEQKLDYINFYGYLLTLVDKEIGNLIKELYAKYGDGISLADTAIVTYTSDHGEMGLAHGGLRQKTFVAYEEALRVPLVISNPVLFSDHPIQQSMALATLVDIMPTFMEIANVSNSPAGLAGTSLLPIIADGTPVQNSILFTYDDTKAGSNSQWSVVNAAIESDVSVQRNGSIAIILMLRELITTNMNYTIW